MEVSEYETMSVKPTEMALGGIAVNPLIKAHSKRWEGRLGKNGCTTLVFAFQSQYFPPFWGISYLDT